MPYLIGLAREIFTSKGLSPNRSNDNAHVEQKNGDVVRRHAFHYRYDTARELGLLNDLYLLARVRLKMFPHKESHRLASQQVRQEHPDL